MLRSIAAFLCVSASVAAACDFETLVTTCLPPTAREDVEFCAQHQAYTACASSAGCLETASVTKVLNSDRHHIACSSTARRSGYLKPEITTEDDALQINGKQVCFSEYGEETVCASQLARRSQVSAQVEDVLVKQGLLAEDLEETKNEITQIVNATLVPLRAELTAAKGLVAEQATTIESIQEELDGNCGKHCYPGHYVKTPCTETTKTACAKCAPGTFSPGGLDRKCPKCTKCSERQFQTSDCSFTEDTGCTDCTTCPTGKYAPLKGGKACANTATAHCVARTACSKTQWMEKEGTPWSNTACQECTTCTKGQFAVIPCTDKANSICKACTTCASDEIEGVACSATQDTLCIGRQPSCQALMDKGVAKDGMYELTIGWTYCILNKDIGGGGWHMAMNIHPNDKHSAAWAAKMSGFKQGGFNSVGANQPTFWGGDIQYSPKGTDKTPFGADYKSKTNNKFAFKEIMIVRHKNQKGAELSNEGSQTFLWRRWKLLSGYAGKTMLSIYRNTYRNRITDGIVEEGLYGNSKQNCPIFGYNGRIYTNFYYSNNGARLLLDGQSLSGENQNDDSSFGLGMEFSSYYGNRRFSGGNGHWCFDASYAECGGSNCAQGNDSCGSLQRNNNYLGEYAIFIR